MSPAPTRARRVERTPLVLRTGPVPARVLPWPDRPTMAHLVVTDSSAVPTRQHLERWFRQLASHGFERVRTGALAARAATQAESAGMSCVQELALLEARAPFRVAAAPPRTRRVTRRMFADLAAVDLDAFGTGWNLDAGMLRDVLSATPRSRARALRRDDVTPSDPAPGTGRDTIAFAMSGRADRTGYVQRLAVSSATRRAGAASRLLDDAFAWFDHHGCDRALVNTDVENDPALALYRRHGFVDLPERLRVYETSIGS